MEALIPTRKIPVPETAAEPKPATIRIPELSLIIAVENDAELLDSTLREASRTLQEISERWELVIVDDCSADGSAELLAGWSQYQPSIRVLTQRPRQGYSRAVARGFAACRYLTVAYTTVRLPVDLHEILCLFAHLHDADMVAGWWSAGPSSATSRLVATVYHRLFRMLLEINARDVCCPLKLFRRSFFEMGPLHSDGSLIDAELFARAERKGLRWAEVEVPVRADRRHRPLLRPGRLPAAVAELRRLSRSV